MERWSGGQWQLPALSGLLLATAYMLPLLVPSFVAFVPLLYWLDARHRADRHVRLRAGYIFGFVFYLLALHFLLVLTRFSWLAVLLYVGFAGVGAIRFLLAIALAGWLRARTRLSWGLLLPVAWLPLEWLMTFGDLRMTGDHVAYGLSAYPFLIQFADLVGHYGVGAFVLCANGLIYEAMLGGHRPARRRAGIALGLLLLAVLGYDAWSWFRDDTTGATTLRVAVIQPNIPLNVKWDSDTAKQQWDTLERLTRLAGEQDPDLIVWPESARPFALYHWLDRAETYRMPEVQALARELNAAFLVGVEYYRVRSETDFDFYNAALAVDAEGNLDPTWAAKVYLVPFAEATPFRSLLGPLIDGRGGEWRWMAGGFEPGARDALLDVDGARVGVLVCYEQLFPDLARGLRNAGADFQVVITNDAWFGRTPFQYYQANAVRLRAIENRSAFVRAANTGISGFVDRKGRYRRMTSLFEEAVEVAEVRIGARPTVYGRTGDVVIWLVWVGLALALVLALRRGAATTRP